MSFDWKKTVGAIAPTIGTVLGGPLGGLAGAALASVFGVENTPDAIEAAVQNATPEQMIALRNADNDFKLKMAELGFKSQADFEKVASDNAISVNATMQTEAKADHWPTYSWRPFVGFVFGVVLLICVVVVAVAYIGVMLGHAKPELLAQIPQFITAMSVLLAVPLPILGIASFFRGKMQADPSIPTDNRG